MVLLPRVSISTVILGTRPGKQDCLGKHWIPSNSQQYVWLEELLTVSQFKKYLINAPRLTMTSIEIEDSLRGSCCRERQPTVKSVCENTDLAQCSVEVVEEAAEQRLRVKEESYKAYGAVTSKTSQRNSSSPTLEAPEQQLNGAGIEDLATQKPSVSKTLLDGCHTARFLISRHRQMHPDDAWVEEITGWEPRSTRDPSSGNSFWPQHPDATSCLGP